MNQDDFRKLLDAGGSSARSKSGGYGGSRNLTSLDLDGIRKLSAKKSSKKKGSKSHKDRDNDTDGDGGQGGRKMTTGSQYRDRAAERRQGINVDDMEDVEEYKHLDVEQSKFLGGDMAHTHLVKGLDFALLSQLKREKQKLEQATAAERLKANGHTYSQVQQQEVEDVDIDEELAKEPTFQTRLGRLVYFHACENSSAYSGKRQLTKSELFLPGRMYYTFNLKSDDVECKPVVVQRSKDDCPEPDDVVSGMIDDMTLAEVQRVMEMKRSGKKMRRKRPEDVHASGDKEAGRADEPADEEVNEGKREYATQPVEENEDEDDDIFPDAGDYVPAYLREDDNVEGTTLQAHEEAGYFSNLSATIAEAEAAARRKEEEAENAWKATLKKAAAAQEKIEKEEEMKARAAKMAAAQDSYGDYDIGGDSDEDDEQAGKKRKGAEGKKDAKAATEIDDDEKNRRKKQRQGNKLENDLKKINKLMESKN